MFFSIVYRQFIITVKKDSDLFSFCSQKMFCDNLTAFSRLVIIVCQQFFNRGYFTGTWITQVNQKKRSFVSVRIFLLAHRYAISFDKMVLPIPAIPSISITCGNWVLSKICNKFVISSLRAELSASSMFAMLILSLLLCLFFVMNQRHTGKIVRHMKSPFILWFLIPIFGKKYSKTFL